MSHVTSVRNPGWLFYIGDSTTQVYRDYDKPLFEDLVMNQSVSRWWFQIFSYFHPYLGISNLTNIFQMG